MRDVDGSITIGVLINSAGLNTGLKTISKDLGRFSNSFNKFGGLVTKAIGVGALIKLGQSALETASDLQEVQNIVDVTFGKQFEQKIEDFTATCLENFGLSELSAKQMAGSFMAMGRSMDLSGDEASDLAVELTGLAGDFSSFYNTTASEARTALSAVFTGETETLKRYGIVITEANLQQFAYTQGIEKSIKAMTAREKVLLRYQYIAKATNFVNGDFIRTQNSWANQTRILTEVWRKFMAVLGTGLITALTPVIKGLNIIIIKLTEFASTVGKILANLFGIQIQKPVSDTSSTYDDLTSAAGSAADAQDGLADSTEKAGKAAKDALAPFDELNVLQMDTGSDGAGGGGGGGGLPDNT